MILNVLKALWSDYVPKLEVLSEELNEHKIRLSALKEDSGDAWKNLYQAVMDCKKEQFAVIQEIVSIYDDVKDALADLKQGKSVQEATGLTRTLADPEYREKVRHYLELARKETHDPTDKL